MTILHRIERLFRERGATLHDGGRCEAVSALEHALQCAHLAEWGKLEPPLIAAALLHDIGHLVGGHAEDKSDDRHEVRGQAFLAASFGPEVVQPVLLHVDAKRYLVSVDPAYVEALSPASARSLALQGGCMTPDELRRFEAQPFALDAVSLRRLDDVARQPGRTTPPLSHYLDIVREVQRAAHAPAARPSLAAG